MSLYEKLMYDLEHDPKVANDVALGKRIRLYRIRNQLGKGNFSKVKLGIHLLTKGTFNQNRRIVCDIPKLISCICKTSFYMQVERWTELHGLRCLYLAPY